MTVTAEARGRVAMELSGTAVTTAVILGAGVITGLLASRTLGPQGRGELTTSTIWPSTILYAGTFGLAEATAYLTARRRDQADSIFLTTQTMAVILGLLIAGAGWFILPAVLSRQSPIVQRHACVYLLLFAVPCLGSLCACAWLQGAGQIASFNVSRGTVHVASALAMAVTALLGLASVTNYLGAMLFGNLLTWAVAVGAWFVHRASSGGVALDLLPPIISYGSRVQLGTWSAAANIRLDQLMLSSLSVSASLGLYVVATSYAGLILILPTAAGMVMLPRLVEECAAGRGGDTLATWYRRVLWTTLGAALCLWLVAGVTLPLLFGRAFSESVPLVSLLIPASCVLGMNQLLGVGFRGHGLPEVASRAETIGLIVTVPMLAILLPRFGPWGAALTSLCAYSASGTYLLAQARHLSDDLRTFCVPTSADWRLIGRMAKSAATLTIAP